MGWTHWQRCDGWFHLFLRPLVYQPVCPAAGCRRGQEGIREEVNQTSRYFLTPCCKLTVYRNRIRLT